MSISNALPKHLRPHREKVFGFARGFLHDRNARVRVESMWSPVKFFQATE